MLGEIFAEGSLDPETDQKNLPSIVLSELQALLAYSKLAVRMQAVWAFGNIIKDILPFRLHCVAQGQLGALQPSLGSVKLFVPRPKEVHRWSDVCSDGSWSRSIQIALTAIQTDSKK